jgi:hypothetical protein
MNARRLTLILAAGAAIGVLIYIGLSPASQPQPLEAALPAEIPGVPRIVIVGHRERVADAER